MEAPSHVDLVRSSLPHAETALKVCLDLRNVKDRRGETDKQQAIVSHLNYDAKCIINYTPTGNTNAYLTKITDALGHISTFKYDFYNGQLTLSTDPNSQSTSYIYNDPINRPTQSNYPDGGQVEVVYNDTAPSPSITTCQLINGTAGATCSATSPASGWKTSLATMDGMGHVVQTALVSDPDGADYSDTSYIGSGWVYTRSTPHRSASATTDGTTTYTYDALGRTKQVAEPDGSNVLTSYSGSCTTITDEVGNARKSCVGGLGRLTSVWEDPGSSPHLNYETDYTYDALNSLIRVNQKGDNSAPRVRTFTYDSLSRLLCAANPEIAIVTCPNPDNGSYTPGTIRYSYDPNGNPATRTAPKPNRSSSSTTVVTSYTYDALNRLTRKDYNDGSTLSAFYSYDSCCWWGITQTNTIGACRNSGWEPPAAPSRVKSSVTMSRVGPR